MNLALLQKQTPALRVVTKLDELLFSVRERRIQPEDRYEVVAILESIGWNDIRAAQELGADDLFDVADAIWEKIEYAAKEPYVYTPPRERLYQLIIMLIRTFLRGIIFSFPMAISVLSMLILRFSLWSYQNLSTDLGTVIAIGTILSFIAVGGFTQAIARRGFFYIFQGYYTLARKVTFYFIRIGFLMAVGLAGLVLLINNVFNLFPSNLMTILVLYFLFLTSIWLSVTVMYILQKELLFTGIIIVGIGVVYVLFRVLHMYIIYSQLISLTVISLISIGAVLYLFKSAQEKHGNKSTTKLPRKSYILYSIFPYFIYGLAYFSFLYVDRIVSWSTNDHMYMPFPIWFRGEYELGLDFALLILLIPMGVTEVMLFSLMRELQENQKQYWASQIARMNSRYVKTYFRNLLIVFVVTVLSDLLIYFGSEVAFAHYSSSIGATLFTDPTTHFVFVWGILAYSLVSISLMNSVTLFSLSQPQLVIKAIWPAFIVNVGLGFLLSRWFSYSDAIFGLLVGAGIFFFVSTASVLRVLSHLDYYLYAAS